MWVAHFALTIAIISDPFSWWIPPNNNNKQFPQGVDVSGHIPLPTCRHKCGSLDQQSAAAAGRHRTRQRDARKRHLLRHAQHQTVYQRQVGRFCVTIRTTVMYAFIIMLYVEWTPPVIIYVRHWFPPLLIKVFFRWEIEIIWQFQFDFAL